LWGSNTRNLDRALDQASQRHGMLSAHLANVNTPGYRRQDLEFGIELEEAQKRSSASKRLPGQGFSRATQGQGGGAGVDLEREVFSLAETELRYQVLTDIAGRYFTGLRNVIREGR
ncbi:MAG: flagellar basal body rod protein FlgB, partial [Fimbriimonadaceae bacterium]